MHKFNSKRPQIQMSFSSSSSSSMSCHIAGLRYLLLALGTLYLSFVFGCVVCFHPALTVMMDMGEDMLVLAHNSSNANSIQMPTMPPKSLADMRFAYTNTEKSLLLAVNYGTCLLLIVPVIFAMQHFGPWRTQLAIGLIVSTATGLIPFAAQYHFYALLFLRGVVGLATTNLFPVLAAIATNWAPESEKGTFLAILTGYIQLTVVLCMPLSGFLADNFGWPSIFFAHSAICLFLSILWAIFYRDEPAEHPFLSKGELKKIKLGKEMAKSSDETNAPKSNYVEIFLNKPILAVMCAVIGNFLVIQFAHTFMPMFFVSALHFSETQTGLLSALPLAIQFIVKWITGFVTDKLPKISDLSKVRFCNSIAFYGAALFFLLATLFKPTLFPVYANVLCITLAIGVLGTNSGGFPKSALLVSGQYSALIMAGIQAMLSATIFVGSFIVPAMTANGGTFSEYMHVFYLYAAALIITNLVFVIFAKASPAKWAM